jgi:hypothetical protein
MPAISVTAAEILPGDTYLKFTGQRVRVISAAHTGPAGQRRVTLRTTHGEFRYDADHGFIVQREYICGDPTCCRVVAPLVVVK